MRSSVSLCLLLLLLLATAGCAQPAGAPPAGSPPADKPAPAAPQVTPQAGPASDKTAKAQAPRFVTVQPPAPTAPHLAIVSITSPVHHGAYATLVVRGPPGANCSITVSYASGASKAQGLYPKATNSSGQVSWSWKVGTRTTPGTWPVYVNCGKGIDLKTAITVT